MITTGYRNDNECSAVRVYGKFLQTCPDMYVSLIISASSFAGPVNADKVA